MRFNAKKCYVLSVKNKSQRFYSLNNTVLSRVSFNPYLGVELSEDLKWTTHIGKITKKASSTIGFLRRNLRDCSRDCWKNAYLTLVRSILDYSAVVWDPYQLTNINKLERIQSQAKRFITQDYTTRTKGHITKLTQELELPPLQERRKNLRLAYMYRVVEGLMPALAPEHYLVTRKPGRAIKAKLFTDYQATNVVETQSINNTKGFTVPQAHSAPYKNSFFFAQS